MSAGDRIRRTTSSDGFSQAPFRKPPARVSYPRRVTLDLDDARYAFLKEAAWRSRMSIAELLRATVSHLEAYPTVLTQVAEQAGNKASDADNSNP